VFDARTAQRFFVADGVNLWSTLNGAAPAATSVTFQDLTSKLPAGFTRPTSVEFISNNGVNALLVGGLNIPLSCSPNSPNGCVISPQQSPITVAYSDLNGNLLDGSWRAFGQKLPNALISSLSYNPTVDVLAAGAVGRGAFVLYDVTSNFPQALTLQFGLANNSSNPDASILTDGTALDGTHFVRPLAKYGTGTLTIAGDATYTGATTVNAGTLEVDGSILNSNSVNVNAGGTLSGTGTVDPPITIAGGGTLAPGNAANPTGTLTIIGNLAFLSGAFYLVQINATAASSTQVTGTASLAGTVLTLFAPSNVLRSYDILRAAGGLGGTTFSGQTTNAPTNFATSLSYTSTDVFLNLTANLVGSSSNQQNVAAAINNFFNSGGTLPPGFLALFNLTDANLANALTLLSGEPATGAQQGAFMLMNQFLGLMLDPFVDGRCGIGGVNSEPIVSGLQRGVLPACISQRYRKVVDKRKGPVYKANPTFEQRWSVWGAAYGGGNRTSGDPISVGSHDRSVGAAGFAAGMDYRLTGDTIVGFALAGGGTGWNLAQGLGSGKSDAFQAGVYGSTRSGPLYLAASLAYTQHWMSTDRDVFADHLAANFNAESFGARAETGYRMPTIFGAVTPYTAIQTQNFRTPTYSESDVIGAGFGLTYNSRDATDTRSELGARYDKQVALNQYAVLAYRARLAWAHDWISDPTLAPTFEALPGGSFIVNGATPAKNSALTSAGAELRLINGVSVLAKFDGEFATHSQTYAGTGIVRYVW
jgi:autotransporter-associated beta strand protein